MSLVDLVRKQVAAERRERFQRSGQLSLGDLIDKLKKQTSEESVEFDFCQAVPTTLASWRGSYDELAIGFAMDDRRRPKVGDLLKTLDDAVGKTFTGYKGGEFVMGLDTPLWVANWGDACNTVITSVEYIDYHVVLHTTYMEF